MFFIFLANAQNEQLAQHYFDRGEFQKSLLAYEQLLQNQPNQGIYFQRVIDCMQQLNQYQAANLKLQQQYQKYRQSSYLVEIGYNYQLQKDETNAQKYYQDALKTIDRNPGEVYGIAAVFERKSLVDYALQAYQKALDLEPNFNFNFQMALLYGQKGELDKMIDKFLIESYANPQNLVVVQNQLSRFITENGSENFNDLLRKALLVRVQKNQDVFWNQYLSWYYVQLKEYGKAFIQEKAIFKRNPDTFPNIINLAELSVNEDDTETAKEIFGFVLENTQERDIQIKAEHFLLKMKIAHATEKDFTAIDNELSTLIKQFGVSPYTLSLQLLQAHFLAFNLKNPEKSKSLLKNMLTLPLNIYQRSQVKMELGDVLLFEEKFNQALIFYAQIEDDLKNDVIGHEASLKVAKTSYFKGDFSWALKQFKELKSAASQLIANDALEYFLLINDNTVADSTQTALKEFARADYLLYQNKKQDALSKFQEILKTYKGQEIESVTLLRLGKIYEQLGDFAQALFYYQQIIDFHPDGIYVDEALFFSAEIVSKKLNEVEKAKLLYEKIVFKHEDSIYFIEARKRFRQLRGDTNL